MDIKKPNIKFPSLPERKAETTMICKHMHTEFRHGGTQEVCLDCGKDLSFTPSEKIGKYKVKVKRL